MYNKAQLIGRIGDEPSHTITPNGTEIVEFQFATSDRYKDKEDTEWHRIKMFGPLAQIMQKHGFKGQLLFIEGKIHYSSWKDTAGNMRYSTEIIANTVKILEWKEEEPKTNPWP